MNEHVATKSIMVTGAGSGFGRLTSLKLGARGASVACVDVDGSTAGTTAAEVEDTGGRAVAIRADVADPEAMRSAAAQAIAAFDRVDVLVNNAGTMPLALFADHAEALPHWHSAIDINLKGTINGIAAVYDHMVERGRGQVVNISSIYSNHPTFGAGVYGATKAAINYVSESLRVETKGTIKVSVVRPTGVSDTGLGGSIVNRAGVKGILGHNYDDYLSLRENRLAGTLDEAMTDPEKIDYLMLEPEHIADAVVYVIDQPDGVSIGDITVRASGDLFIV